MWRSRGDRRLAAALAVGLAATVGMGASAAAPPGPGPGRITGRVIFPGELPVLPPIDIVKDQEACGTTAPAEALVVSPRTRGVRWAVVSLDGAPATAAREPRAAALENRSCRFAPHVGAVQVGAELAILNADPVLHNLRAWAPGEPRRQVFNVVQPTQGQVSRRTIKRPGVAALTCDTHAHMSGYLLAFDHAWFAVTDEEGEFAIDGVPAGTYRLTAWHEGWTVLRRLPEGRPVFGPPVVLTQDVTVPPGGTARVSFELAAPR